MPPARQFGMDESLFYSHYAPATHPRLMNVRKKGSRGSGVSESIFSAIRRGDILVRNPQTILYRVDEIQQQKSRLNGTS